MPASQEQLETSTAESNLVKNLADQVWRQDLLVLESDRDQVDVDARRTRALLNDLINRDSKLVKFDGELRQLEERNRQIALTDKSRGKLHTEIIALRRQIAFANPLLDFQQILILTSRVTIS